MEQLIGGVIGLLVGLIMVAAVHPLTMEAWMLRREIRKYRKMRNILYLRQDLERAKSSYIETLDRDMEAWIIND